MSKGICHTHTHNTHARTHTHTHSNTNCHTHTAPRDIKMSLNGAATTNPPPMRHPPAADTTAHECPPFAAIGERAGLQPRCPECCRSSSHLKEAGRGWWWGSCAEHRHRRGRGGGRSHRRAATQHAIPRSRLSARASKAQVRQDGARHACCARGDASLCRTRKRSTR